MRVLWELRVCDGWCACLLRGAPVAQALGDTKGAEARMRQSQQACVNELVCTHYVQLRSFRGSL